MVPLKVQFRDMDSSEAVISAVEKKASGLEKLHKDIQACTVTISAPHKHSHHGGHFHVGIHLKLPDGELMVNREPTERQTHEDVYISIRDAFDALKRQIEHHNTKKHK